MPSGYTERVATGSIEATDEGFKEYALSVARAFGALVMLRDEPQGAAIPDKLEPSSYHKDKLKECQDELAVFKAASHRELTLMCNVAYERKLKYDTEEIERRKVIQQRYEKMLGKCWSYVPPSPDHEHFKKFMISQLVDSIQWDCSLEYYEKNKPVLMSGEDYRAEMVESLEHDIEYHKNEYAKDVEITNERNEWLRLLRESLGV